MPKPFKDYLSKDLLSFYGQILKQLWPAFNQEQFLSDSTASPWDTMELKERMRRITESLTSALPSDFHQSIQLIIASVAELRPKKKEFTGIEFIFLPDFVELNGLPHFDASIKAMEEITEFMSCEFAVRPFIVAYDDRMMDVMLKWSMHENEHLRRLASEGCRPRLPWAMALPNFKRNPAPLIPILENLKTDSSEYVRRSVANNLNDISKDHPEMAFAIFKKWYGKNKETNALVKHGMRTLLKGNYPGSMQLLGYARPDAMAIQKLELRTAQVHTGDSMTFSFVLKNRTSSQLLIRLEYAVYFKLSNGKNTRKVFKISERNIEPEERLTIVRSHSFRFITTRTYYAGEHFVSPIVNGIEGEKRAFNLIQS